MQPFSSYKEKQAAIKFIKDKFSQALEQELNLAEVCAPILTKHGDGIQDDLNGIEKPVTVQIKTIPNTTFEVVHSLAKWKRLLLSQHEFQQNEGIYTHMLALRPDEEKLDASHSVCVDQWDWEMVIDKEERSLEKLKTIVEKLYECIKTTHIDVCTRFFLEKFLPEKITFIHTEDLAKEFPDKTSKEREHEICKRHKAVFLIGIGGEISPGLIHDGRAPDYDDWTTPTYDHYKGLNGDILVWNPALQDAFEISSMGIRVDKEALLRQLKIRDREKDLACVWHQLLVSDKLLQTIGGGIGRSRLTMFLLQQKHIGDVQCSVWP